MSAALADTAQAGAGNSVVVFRPGDPLGSRGNIVTTDVELFERLARAQGNVVVNVDDSIEAAVLSTPGTYRLLHVVFTGNESTIGFDAKLHWGEGVKVAFGQWPAFTAGIQVEFEGSTPAITIDGAGLPFIPLFRLDYRASIKCTGTGPFIHVTNGGAMVIASTLGASLYEGTAPIVQVDAGCLVLLAGSDAAGIESNVLDGGGSFVRQFLSSSANISGTQGSVTPASGGGGPTDPWLFAKALWLDPSVAVAADWNGGDAPPTQAIANDDLAARISPVGSGIPDVSASSPTLAADLLDALHARNVVNKIA
jgi:hypothetical protein